MLNNSLFCGILLTTAILQVLIVQFGSVAFSVADGGLDAQYWGISLAIGAVSLPVRQIINLIYFILKRLGCGKGGAKKASTPEANGSHP